MWSGSQTACVGMPRIVAMRIFCSPESALADEGRCRVESSLPQRHRQVLPCCEGHSKGAVPASERQRRAVALSVPAKRLPRSLQGVMPSLPAPRHKVAIIRR